MSDRIGEDALLDVGCCLNRFEVDSIQCLSWKSHTYLANKSHILPMRLLEKAVIDGSFTLVSARDHTRGSVRFDGTQPEVLQFALAAIKDSDIESLKFLGHTGDPMTEEEAAQITAIAGTVKVEDLHLCGRLAQLSPPTLHHLMFSFSSVEGLNLTVNGSQLTDEFLRECGRRQIWRLRVTTESGETGPLAVDDEDLMDYLFASEYGMPKRDVVLSAFNSSPQFAQKLINRAKLATNIDRVDLDVQHLSLDSQQFGGMRLRPIRKLAEHVDRFENGAHVALEFGRERVLPPRAGLLDEDEEPKDKFRFGFWK